MRRFRSSSTGIKGPSARVYPISGLVWRSEPRRRSSGAKLVGRLEDIETAIFISEQIQMRFKLFCLKIRSIFRIKLLT
jgi:hypothetical protein